MEAYKQLTGFFGVTSQNEKYSDHEYWKRYNFMNKNIQNAGAELWTDLL